MPGYNSPRRSTARILPKCLCCSVYCLFLSFCVLFLCKCALYYCHRGATQLHLNIPYHIIFNDFHTACSTHLAGLQILRPFSDFIITYPGKIVFKYMKAGLFPFTTLKFFMNPSLMCNGGT
jgi:hypothetical protein